MPNSTRPQVRTNDDPIEYTDVGKAADGGVPMPVESTGGTNLTGAATSANQTTIIANQTNSTQKTKITDGTDDADVETVVDSTTNMDGKKGVVVNAVLYGRVSDTQFLPLKVDPSTQSIQTVAYEHHEIHDGSHYSVFINKDVAIAGTFTVAFTTPNTTKWIHMLFSVVTEVEADIILYEGITSWTGGSAITPINNNRNSANTSGITDMAQDATITLGTPVTIAHAVTGSGRNYGGGARNDAEYVLKQNTKYYLLVTNQTAGATNEVNIGMQWYEHTNAN